MSTGDPRPDPKPVVLRISPTAHLASGFGALGLLAVVLAVPWTAPLLVIPVIASAMIVRLRTVADTQTVTARTLLEVAPPAGPTSRVCGSSRGRGRARS